MVLRLHHCRRSFVGSGDRGQSDVREQSGSTGSTRSWQRQAGRSIPVIALGDGWHPTASSAGLFLAASTRVCTDRDRTVLAWPESSPWSQHSGTGRSGALEIPGPLWRCAAAAASDHVLYVLLTGASLNPHDCIQA